MSVHDIRKSTDYNKIPSIFASCHTNVRSPYQFKHLAKRIHFGGNNVLKDHNTELCRQVHEAKGLAIPLPPLQSHNHGVALQEEVRVRKCKHQLLKRDPRCINAHVGIVVCQRSCPRTNRDRAVAGNSCSSFLNV